MKLSPYAELVKHGYIPKGFDKSSSFKEEAITILLTERRSCLIVFYKGENYCVAKPAIRKKSPYSIKEILRQGIPITDIIAKDYIVVKKGDFKKLCEVIESNLKSLR